MSITIRNNGKLFVVPNTISRAAEITSVITVSFFAPSFLVAIYERSGFTTDDENDGCFPTEMYKKRDIFMNKFIKIIQQNNSTEKQATNRCLFFLWVDLCSI